MFGWKHSMKFAPSVKGELSYLQEEVAELGDVEKIGGCAAWKAVECSDIIGAVGMYSRTQLGVPLIWIVLLCYVRKPYKFVRNLFLDLMGYEKCSG